MLFTNHIPNIQRLIAEGEEVVYVGRQHPLYGWEWLLGSFAGVALSIFVATFVPYIGWVFLAAAIVCFIIYLMPFYYFEMAVTTHRFLAQQGRWDVEMLEILPIHLDHWDLKQNVLLGLLRAGHVTLHLRSGMAMRENKFIWLDDPLSLLANLEKLSPNSATAAGKAGMSKLPATVENQKNAPGGGAEPTPPVDKQAQAPKAPAPEITGQHFAPGLKPPQPKQPTS